MFFGEMLLSHLGKGGSVTVQPGDFLRKKGGLRGMIAYLKTSLLLIRLKVGRD